LQKVRKLIESDKVDLVCGPQGSNVALAILPYVKQSNAFLIISGAGLRDLSFERYPYLFRTSVSVWQISTPLAGWVYDNQAKEIVLAASDYAGGRDVLSQFRAAYEKHGGKVLKEVYPPLGNNDYSPYLSVIRNEAPPAVYCFFDGADAARFVRQYSEYGLSGKIPLIGFASLVDNTTFDAQGDSAIGVKTGSIYTDTLATAENQSFVERYRAKYNVYPNLYSVYGYTTARVIHDALIRTDGDSTNKDRLAAAMVGLAFDDPRGKFRFDPVTHQPIQNLYVLEAMKVEGRVANKVIHTIEDVRDPGVKE
jgi:branched-chain amino acid transport system substrate-binding protein